MKYIVSYQHPHRSIIDFELIINNIHNDYVDVKIPAWRPGRYQIQNFAKNVRQFQAFDIEQKPCLVQKITKSTWRIHTKATHTIRVKYEYFARQVDAGGSWLKKELLYINWINCGLYIENRRDESYEIELQIPRNYQIASGLTHENNQLFAKNFDELVDSPLIASPNLQHYTYQCEGYASNFHIWIEGNVNADEQKLIRDFHQFTKHQLGLFKDFNVSDYHFLFLILPFKHYHGVEHRNSTVIVMGEDRNFNDYYASDVLGISSHELFHFWNAIRIRPAALTPYDYDQENYFETGFIIEGLTTYYGDYLLFRSGVWSQALYFQELNQTFKKHFDNAGRFYKSLTESSVDLWLDGYELGIPNRKVSIYIKGAISALILDLEIRKITRNDKSLDDVMRLLWQKYGKTNTGYSVQDYIQIVRQVSGTSFQSYFDQYIFGKTPIESQLNNALQYIDCELITKPARHWHERILGLQVLHGSQKIIRIAPNSPADMVFTVDDEILAINGTKPNEIPLEWESKIFLIKFSRIGKEMETEIKSDGKTYFTRYQIQRKPNGSLSGKENFEKWASS